MRDRTCVEKLSFSIHKSLEESHQTRPGQLETANKLATYRYINGNRISHLERTVIYVSTCHTTAKCSFSGMLSRGSCVC